MSKYVRAILLLLCCVINIIPLLAHDTSGHSRIYASFAPQYYFNKNNITHNGLSPDLITTKNTFGYCFGLEFERVTRYGLILNAGLRFGMRKHDIILRQDFSEFDPDAVNNLKGYTYTSHIAPTLYYINPSIKIGYRLRLTSSWTLSAKLGLFQTQYLNGIEYLREGVVSYMTDDSVQYRYAQFITYQVSLGETDRKTRIRNKLFKSTMPVYECYIGFEKDWEKGFIRSMCAGIEFNNKLIARVVHYHYIATKSTQTLYASDLSFNNYFDNNVCMALKLSVGLWR